MALRIDGWVQALSGAGCSSSLIDSFSSTPSRQRPRQTASCCADTHPRKVHARRLSANILQAVPGRVVSSSNPMVAIACPLPFALRLSSYPGVSVPFLFSRCHQPLRGNARRGRRGQTWGMGDDDPSLPQNIRRNSRAKRPAKRRQHPSSFSTAVNCDGTEPTDKCHRVLTPALVLEEDHRTAEASITREPHHLFAWIF